MNLKLYLKYLNLQIFYTFFFFFKSRNIYKLRARTGLCDFESIEIVIFKW